MQATPASQKEQKMPVETATYIADLVDTNPLSTDGLLQGDDHIRLIKSVLLATFPNLSAAVAAGATDLANGFTPVGGIILWSGAIADIPANWQICDGTNGTPNLRNKFIVGAGDSYAVAATGGAASFSTTPTTTNDGSHIHTGTTDSQGSHSHGGTVGGTALDITQIPSHQHISGGAQTMLSTAGGVFLLLTSGSGTVNVGEATEVGQGGNQEHSHGISADGNHSHNLTIAGAGSHTHTVTVGATTLPPYYALAYIQRIT